MEPDSTVLESSPSTSDRSRQLQCWLVIAIAFGLPLAGSLFVFVGHRTLHVATPRAFVRVVIFQLIGLFSLFWVLRHQKRSFREIGVRFPLSIAEVGHAFALFFGAFPLGIVVGLVVFGIYAAFGHPVHRTLNEVALFGDHITVMTVLFVLLNPFHEELIVRGFLITEMEHFYRNTNLAIFVSVLIQSSYHLYQGLPAALVHASTFLLFSVYFVRTRRILPIVLAHLFMDVTALSLYAHHLKK